MEKYIGTKLIEAEPCPAWRDTNAHKIGDPGYKVRYADGYESWSPKDVFEEAYRTIDGMNFGLALEAMRKGCKVRRRGWSSGQHIELVSASDGQAADGTIRETLIKSPQRKKNVIK